MPNELRRALLALHIGRNERRAQRLKRRDEGVIGDYHVKKEKRAERKEVVSSCVELLQ